MDCQFDWRTSINLEIRRLAEASIRSDLESGHVPFGPCHDGTVLVTLSSPDPFEETLLGSIGCKCGNPIGTLKGASDGSEVTYAAIEGKQVSD